MYSKVKYILVFILFMVFCEANAQQSETIEPAQSGVVKDIQYAKQKAEELQNKVFTKIDPHPPPWFVSHEPEIKKRKI